MSPGGPRTKVSIGLIVLWWPGQRRNQLHQWGCTRRQPWWWWILELEEPWPVEWIVQDYTRQWKKLIIAQIFWLLTQCPNLTLSFFFGIIIGSGELHPASSHPASRHHNCHLGCVEEHLSYFYIVASLIQYCRLGSCPIISKTSKLSFAKGSILF